MRGRIGPKANILTYWTITFQTGEVSAAIWIFNEQNAHNLKYKKIKLRHCYVIIYMNEEISEEFGQFDPNGESVVKQKDKQGVKGALLNWRSSISDGSK